MNKPILYIMIGLSGSGKSSIAKEIAKTSENTIIVSSDAIREELTGKVEDQTKNEEVFKIFHKRIQKGLENIIISYLLILTNVIGRGDNYVEM